MSSSTVAVQSTRVLPCDHRHAAVWLLEEVRQDVEGAQLVGATTVVPHAATASRSAIRTCSTSAIGSWRKRLPIAGTPPDHRSSGNDTSPPELGLVLDCLACERLGDLERRLVRGEDERHVAAEHPLQDRPDQRVVRAAEHDGVDTLRRLSGLGRPRAPPRRSPRRTGRRLRSTARASGTRPARPSRRRRVSRSASRSGRSPRSPRSRAARRGGCAWRGRLRAPPGWITPSTGTVRVRCRSGSAAAVAELQAATTSLTPCPSR